MGEYYFSPLYYLRLTKDDHYGTNEDDMEWVNVSDDPRRFYYLLGWFKRNHFTVTWVITPSTITVNGREWKVYFYIGHVVGNSKDIVKFKLVHTRDNLDL